MGRRFWTDFFQSDVYIYAEVYLEPIQSLGWPSRVLPLKDISQENVAYLEVPFFPSNLLHSVELY